MQNSLINKTVFLCFGLIISNLAVGHGLMTEPPARNAFCGYLEKADQAVTPACVAAAQDDSNGLYQFMSVLTHDIGRMGGPSTHVCGFDSEPWGGEATPWDQQYDWPTTAIQSGKLDITWNISWGPHYDDTEEFRYWITKPDFTYQVGATLTWDDFESAPFCVLNYNDAAPSSNPNVVPDKGNSLFHTTCTVPARQGRHIIYGEWGRNYFTYERFHGCLDVIIDGTPGSSSSSSSVASSSSISSSSSVASSTSSASSSATSTSSSSSSTGSSCAAMCQWYQDDVRPLCANQDSGWGYEQNQSCIGRTTCVSQTGTGGIINSCGSSSVASSPSSSSSSSASSSTGSSSGLACDYVVSNEWNDGFTAEVRLTNTGTEPVTGWEVSWQYADGSTITNSWNTTLAGSNPYTASNVDWNAQIAAGATISFGLQANKGGDSIEIPSLQGSQCGH